ncbi:MAG: YbhB/YbcL family Raf kinase inhibitor-like protein [Actinomycetales bacterium]|nr:YbhB/YbcL family Raf kinase inhibitor-like protein [Actinomycetales bacterium]
MSNDPFWRLPEVPSLEVTSPDFGEGDPLPVTARASGAGGADRSPALAWSPAPPPARSLVVTCYDPDAPTGSGWWHWAVHGLPADLTELPANAGDPAAGLLPTGAMMLPDETRTAHYGGAWPPPGHGPHRYVFTVSALDVPALDLPDDATPGMLGFLMFGHVVARGHLTGTSETPAG